MTCGQPAPFSLVYTILTVEQPWPETLAYASKLCFHGTLKREGKDFLFISSSKWCSFSY